MSATHKHRIGEDYLYYKNSGGAWWLWLREKERWVMAMVVATSTQKNGDPWGFVKV